MADQNNGNSNGGMSNEQIDRLFMIGVLGVVGVIFLMVLPILLGGFTLSLIWYGAYMEDGEPNGEKLIWPVLISFLTFVFFVGSPGFLQSHFPGVLFTDLEAWTSHQVGSVVSGINEWLPRKHEIRSVQIHTLQVLAWLMWPTGIAGFLFLHFKGAGRGGFVFQGLKLCLMPLRYAGMAYPSASMASVALSSLATIFMHAPYWFREVHVLFGMPFMIFAILEYLKQNRMASRLAQNNSSSLASSKTNGRDLEVALHSAPAILVGHEKGRQNRAVKLTSDQLNHHVHIVGASGFGKSVLLSHVLRNRIESNQGVMFVDLKADFETIRQVVSIAKSAGRLDDLKIFSCGNPEFSTPYNVVKSGTANQLKDRIMGAMNWSEEFYKNEAASFLIKILKGLTLVRDKRGEAFDLSTIYRCATDVAAVEELLEKIPLQEKETTEQLISLSQYLSKPENRKSLQGLRSQLESLMLSDFGKLLKVSDDGIDLFDAINERKIVYVLLDSRTYGESARALGKLILQDLKAVSARIDNEISRDERTPFTVVIDEFADLATEDFIGFLDRARSSKIGVVVAHQEIADLSKVSEEFARRLMNATSTLFGFLQKLPDSSALIAGITGTKRTKEVTEQAKSNWLFGDEKTGMKSIKEVDEYVIHPNTIRSLTVGECVMVGKYPTSSAAVVKVRREETLNYLSDSEVREILLKVNGQREGESRQVVKRESVMRKRLEDSSQNDQNVDGRF